MNNLVRTLRTVTLFTAIIGLFFYLSISDPAAEMESASYAYRHGDYHGAMRFARRAALLGDAQIKGKAYRLVAESARDLGRNGVALNYMNRAIAVWPECGECYLTRGDLLYSEKAFKKAAADYTEAFHRIGTFNRPKGAEYIARRAISRLRSGDNGGGCRDADTAKKFYASSPLAHFAKSLCFYRKGEIDSATKEAKEALELGKKIPFFFSKEESRYGEDWIRYYAKITTVDRNRD